MSSEQTPHLLFCAFSEAPGPSAAGTRTHQLISAFSDDFDVDALSLKGPELQHIQRVGAARMMRVPVEGKPFTERLAAYQRALTRQLSSDSYQLVWCADLFSAQVAAAFREAQGFELLVEVAELPSAAFAQRYPVRPDDKRLKAQWREAERQAFRAASRIVVPSRHAARRLGEKIDPRLLRVLPRAVDRGLFSPPSVELSLDERRTVLVVGGREGARELEAVRPLLEALYRALPEDRVRLVLAGAAREEDEAVRERLAAAGLTPRFTLADVESPARLAHVLCDADVVVVPTSAELSLEPWAVPYRALEAMACRRATVITGPEAPLQDALVPGEEALVVPGRSPARLVSAVERLLDSPSRREAVAQAGARRVEQQADLTSCIGELAALITEHLGVAMRPKRPEVTEPGDPPLLDAPRAVSLPDAAGAEGVSDDEGSGDEGAFASRTDTDDSSFTQPAARPAFTDDGPPDDNPFAEPASPPPGIARAALFEPAEGETVDGLLSDEAGAFFEGAFDPQPTDIEERPEDSSLLFTDEAELELPPAAPPPPSVVDVRASDSVLGSAIDSVLGSAIGSATGGESGSESGSGTSSERRPDPFTERATSAALLANAPTRVAEPPPGLVEALRTVPRAVSLEGEGASKTGRMPAADEWFGETRIDTGEPSNMTGATQRDTDVLLTPEPATSSESRPVVRPGKDSALPAPRALDTGEASAPGQDPWAGDTIADASPFLDDPSKKDTNDDDTERSGRVARARTAQPRSSSGGLLVDRSPEVTVEDRPAVGTSSEG